MQKKRPILRRAWDFVAVTTIAPLGKVARRRIANCCGGGGGGRQLALFKRARRLSLLRHYSYHFIGEYEFSPDSTPLFPRGRGRGAAPKKRSRLLRLLMCSDGGGGDSRGVSGVEAIGWQEDELETTAEGNVEASEGGQEPPEAPSEWSSTEDEDDESVDRRAEMFIERFYGQMRIQRQESEVEYAEMLDRSC